MKGVRCHITGRIQRSKRCADLRKHLGVESCPLVCGLLSYWEQEKFKKATEEKKEREREKQQEEAFQKFKAFLKSTGDDD